MPEHTSFFSYLIAMFPALGQNMSVFGDSFLGHEPVDAHGAEPLAASLAVMLARRCSWRCSCSRRSRTTTAPSSPRPS